MKRIRMTDTPPPAATYEEVSGSETEESEEELELNEELVENAFYLILGNSPLLSSRHPGYLLAFLEYLTKEKDPLVEPLLAPLEKILTVWINSKKRITKKVGVLAYLKNLDDLLGITFRTLLSAKTMKKLRELLAIFKEEVNFTEEELSSLVSTKITSMSSTTVPSRTKRAGVGGSKRQRLCLDSDEEIDLPEDAPCATRSDLPTYKTYSSTLAYSGGEQYILKSEDKWNDCYIELKIWRSKDLADVTQSDWETRTRKVRKVMKFHFSENNTSINAHLKGIEEGVKQCLLKKGAQWEQNRFNSWKKY